MAVITKRRIGQTDLMVSTLGLGCASIGNLYHKVPTDEANKIVKSAWDAGFRYFDTAPHYGQGLSERRIGDALRGQVSGEYALSTKVGRLLQPAGYAEERHGFVSPMPFDFIYDYSYDGVMRSFEDSLQRLGLDSVDILYMHDIGAATHGDKHASIFRDAMEGGFRALEELKNSGMIKAIGIGANEYEVCEEALDYGDWDCFLLAGRYTLLEQEALNSFLPKCVERKSTIIIGGPYNSGILATGTKGKGPWHYDYGRAPDDVVAKVSKIETICAEFNIELAAAALQFPLAHPAVCSVIPGIGSARRVYQTLDLFSTEIPIEFWSALSEHGLLSDGAPVPGTTGGLIK